MTVLRAVCSADVRAEAATDFGEKTARHRQGCFKSLVRDLPYGLITCFAAILTLFGILVALLNDWAP